MGGKIENVYGLASLVKGFYALHPDLRQLVGAAESTEFLPIYGGKKAAALSQETSELSFASALIQVEGHEFAIGFCEELGIPWPAGWDF